jgi:hypothetical protein
MGKYFWPKADCKFTAQNACPFGKDKMAQLMEKNKRSKNNDKRYDGIQTFLTTFL